MNHTFAMLPVELIRYLLGKKLTAAEHSVFLYLLGIDPFGQSWRWLPPMQEVADQLGIHLRSLRRAVNKIKKLSLFEIKEERNSKGTVVHWSCRNNVIVRSKSDYSSGKEIPRWTFRSHLDFACPENILGDTVGKGSNPSKTKDQQYLKETNKDSSFVSEDEQEGLSHQLSLFHAERREQPNSLLEQESINPERGSLRGSINRESLPPPPLLELNQTHAETEITEFSTAPEPYAIMAPKASSTKYEENQALLKAESFGVKLDAPALERVLELHPENLIQAVACLEENKKRVENPTRFLQSALAKGWKPNFVQEMTEQDQFKAWALEAYQQCGYIKTATTLQGQFVVIDTQQRLYRWHDLKDLPWAEIDRICSAVEEVHQPQEKRPIDLSGLLAEINVHLKRLKWGRDKVQEFLLSQFGVKRRDMLDDSQLAQLEMILRST